MVFAVVFVGLQRPNDVHLVLSQNLPSIESVMDWLAFHFRNVAPIRAVNEVVKVVNIKHALQQIQQYQHCDIFTLMVTSGGRANGHIFLLAHNTTYYKTNFGRVLLRLLKWSIL